MNRDKSFIESIISELKKNKISPDKTYYQDGSNLCSYKNFPVGNFISLAEAEQQNELQCIILNEDYQYKTVVTQMRESIDILYPLDRLDSLSEGMNYFIFDAYGQLCPLISIERILEHNSYIRIFQKHKKVHRIQKRVLTSIWKTSYIYWDNYIVRKEINEKLDIDSTVLYQVISFYDKRGEPIKSIFYDSVTHQKEIYKINNQVNPTFEIDVYNETGMHTNHIIGDDLYDYSIKNHHLDEKGDVIKVTHGLMAFFHSKNELPIRSACRLLSAELNKVSVYAPERCLSNILFYNSAKLPKVLDILRIIPMEEE